MHTPGDPSKVLEYFSGHPDLPNGLPAGVLAYMAANATRDVDFAYGPAGVRRLKAGEKPAAGEEVHRQKVPYRDLSSNEPLKLYYAVIETDSVGVTVAIFPKGTQDIHAIKPGKGSEPAMHIVVELGQRRQLINLLKQITKVPDLSDCKSREEELTRLHEAAVKALSDYGCTVSIESMFTTAKRETKEEHGFDFTREQPNIERVDYFVEGAYSKRRPTLPIEHHVYAAEVTNFDSTLPARNVIKEEKNPNREGHTYLENGTFMTLEQMHESLAAAKQNGNDHPYDATLSNELNATESRLLLMERVERAIVRRMRAEGVMVASSCGPGPEAAAVRSMNQRVGRGDATQNSLGPCPL